MVDNDWHCTGAIHSCGTGPLMLVNKNLAVGNIVVWGNFDPIGVILGNLRPNWGWGS